MSERLVSLNRQKQLLEEHLRWLENEIAEESGESKETSKVASISPFPKPEIEAKPSKPITAPTVAAFHAEENQEDMEDLSEQLISQYGHISARREIDPRLGLVLFFGGVLGFLGLVVFLFYWFGYR